MESRPATSCPNCGAPAAESFCASCGQKRPNESDYSLRGFLTAVFGQITNYDSRLVRTLRLLFAVPGQLARDHFEGRRQQNLEPARLFILFNLVAWLVVPYTTLRGFSMAFGQRHAMWPELWMKGLALRAEWAKLTLEQYGQKMDAMAGAKNSLAILCLVPLLALGLQVLMAGRGYRFVQHLIFTAHFYCIHLLCVLFFIGVLFRPTMRLFQEHQAIVGSMWFQHFQAALILIPYLFVALGRAYELDRRAAAWRAVALGLWSCLLTRAFFDVVFVLLIVSI